MKKTKQEIILCSVQGMLDGESCCRLVCVQHQSVINIKQRERLKKTSRDEGTGQSGEMRRSKPGETQTWLVLLSKQSMSLTGYKILVLAGMKLRPMHKATGLQTCHCREISGLLSESLFLQDCSADRTACLLHISKAVLTQDCKANPGLQCNSRDALQVTLTQECNTSPALQCTPELAKQLHDCACKSNKSADFSTNSPGGNFRGRDGLHRNRSAFSKRFSSALQPEHKPEGKKGFFQIWFSMHIILPQLTSGCKN